MVDIMARARELGTAVVDGAKEAAEATRLKAVEARFLADLATSPTLATLLENVGNKVKMTDEQKAPLKNALLKKYDEELKKETSSEKKDKNPSIIEKLEKELKANPALATKLEQSIIANPNGFLSVMNQYNGSNLQALVDAYPSAARPATPAATVSPVSATAPAAAAQVGTTAAPPRRPTAAASTPPSPPPSRPPAATTPSAAAPSAPATPAAAQPPAQAAGAPATGAGSAQAASASATDVEREAMRAVLEKLSTSTDQEISAMMNPLIVKGLASGMAEQAKTKFGVEAQTADAFAKKIKDDPALAKRIEDNLKRNPELVRELALASKNQGQLPSALRAAGKTIMDAVMANPGKLADDAYAQDLAKKMRAGREAQENGIGAAFSSLFDKLKEGDFKGFFSQIGDMIMGFLNKFLGGNSGPNMPNNGNGFGDALSRVVSGFGRKNGIERLTDSDMTAYPPPGQTALFKTVTETGPDGKEVTRQVPNTVQIAVTQETNNGTRTTTTMGITPAVGAGVIAKQLPGAYANDGSYKPGLISVPVVTGYKSNGEKKYGEALMTEQQFGQYQDMLRQASANDPRFPGGRVLNFEGYTVADAVAKRERDLASGTLPQAIDPATGQMRVSGGGGRVYNEGQPVRAAQTTTSNDAIFGNDPNDLRPRGYGSA